MRNKQLQEKLEAMLVELRKQDDDMAVCQLTSEGLRGVRPIGVYLVDDLGIEVDEASTPERIVLYI